MKYEATSPAISAARRILFVSWVFIDVSVCIGPKARKRLCAFGPMRHTLFKICENGCGTRELEPFRRAVRYSKKVTSGFTGT